MTNIGITLTSKKEMIDNLRQLTFTVHDQGCLIDLPYPKDLTISPEYVIRPFRFGLTFI
jgi:hypothetical protein